MNAKILIIFAYSLAICFSWGFLEKIVYNYIALLK